MLKIPFAAVLVSAAGLVAVPAGAQTATASAASAASTRPVAAVDKSFTDNAAVGGLTEVKLGEVAGTNAQSQAVKDFGKHMVDDHSKANDELASLAKGKGLTPPSAPDAPHQKVVDKLSALKGRAFDNAYWKQMLDDHKKTIALFQKESASGKDPEIKAFATKTLPTLKQHLQMVQEGMKAPKG